MKQWFGLVLALALGAMAGCDAADSSGANGGGKGAKTPHWVYAATVVRHEVAHSAVRTGTLKARRQVKLINQEAGRIDHIAVFEGDAVAKGDVLLRLDARLLKAQLQKAAATRRQAASDVVRLDKLVARDLAPAEELATARTALEVAKAEESLLRTRLDYATLEAPFDGIVTQRLAEPGDVASQFAHLLTLIDPASLYTEVAVSELLLPLLKVGDAAVVQMDALPGTPLQGRIARIHPTVDEASRQGLVEVDLLEIPPAVSPGGLARVSLSTRAAERLVMPFTALRRGPDGEYVYVVAEGQRAQQRAVRTGLRIDGAVEVLDGLAAGEQVVTKGFLGLSDGKAVSVAEVSDEAAS